jgi:transposase
VIYVDPRHSSQQCRQCGHIASESRESQAVFRCVACGHEDHADANAAKNVLARGLACSAVPAQAPGLRGVRPHKTPVNPGAAGTTWDAA